MCGSERAATAAGGGRTRAVCTSTPRGTPRNCASCRWWCARQPRRFLRTHENILRSVRSMCADALQNIGAVYQRKVPLPNAGWTWALPYRRVPRVMVAVEFFQLPG